MTVLHRRVEAAQAALDAYLNRELQWGEADCARLAAHTLRHLGVATPLAKFGRYTTAAGAMRALKRRGFADLAEVMDSLGRVRIPPAAALPADIVALPAEDGFVALTVALGNGRLLGFYSRPDGVRCSVLQPESFLTAWRSC